MKFTVLKSNFGKALNNVSRVVSTRTTLPVLNNILISAGKNKIRLSATDLEVAITSQSIGKIEVEGELTIPARLLSDFVTNNSDESIEFHVKNENILSLKSEHFEANITGISAEEFPTVPELPKEQFCELNAAAFAENIKKVGIAPANDETRPVLAGIFFHFNDKELTLAATDSFRLAEKKMELGESIEEKKLIVPNRTMNEVCRLISAIEGAENISISSTENQVAFKIGETEVVSRLIEGAFPNYTQIIPTSSKINVTVGHHEFVSAVKMSSLFAKNAANNIRIKTDDKCILVSSIASETGESVSRVEAEISGGGVKVAFNARYVLDFLQVIPQDKVVLELNDNVSAGVFKSEKDSSYTYIIMPLRIDE